LDLTEERYIGVVRSKTAILMSAACEAGAILGGVSTEKQKSLSDFGMDLGIAFQLMDDTLDYIASEEMFGKSIGHDLEEGKFTLPLIHTLLHCTPAERSAIETVVKKDEMTLDEFRHVSGLVKQHGGIDYTVDAARRYIGECRSQLEVFEATPVLSALLGLADYVVTRNH